MAFNSRCNSIQSNQDARIQNLDSWAYRFIEEIAAPSIEQAKSLTSLDRETARIDALVEKKNRFIELLKEKRRALITHAVTRGLEPQRQYEGFRHWGGWAGAGALGGERLKRLNIQCQNGV